MSTVDVDVTVARLRRHLPEPEKSELARLGERLVVAAERAGLVDVAHRTIESPFGAVVLAATPVGLARVGLAAEDPDAVLDELSRAVSPRLLVSPRRLDEAARQIDAYFAGTLRAFDLQLDLQLAHGFRRDVIERLRSIAYGATETYAGIARAAGRPTAVRAAASACSHNPLPIVLPCHRVIRSDGSIGEYGGGAPMKRALLAMEAGA